MESPGSTLTAPVPKPAVQASTPQETNPAQVGMSKESKLQALKEITQAGSTATSQETGTPESQEAATKVETPAAPKDPIEAMLDEVLPAETGSEGWIDKVTHGGVEKPVIEALEDAKFMVPYRKGEREINGIGELYKLAAMGLSSTENNTKAKQVVAETQKIFSDFEKQKPSLISKGVKEVVEKRFQQGLSAIQSGYLPNGVPIKDVETQRRAVADLQALQAWVLGEEAKASAPASTANGNLNAEELKEQIRKELAAEFEGKQQQQTREATYQKLAQETTEMVGEVTKPFAQKFLKSDGKTVNDRQFRAFVNETQLTAANYADRVSYKFPEGMPYNIRKAILQRAAKDTLADFVQESKPAAKPIEPGLKSGSGMTPQVPVKKDEKPVAGPKQKPFTPGWFRLQRSKA